ncbi:hypothetical protein ACHAXH_002196 [Discostella pseudostelligera]
MLLLTGYPRNNPQLNPPYSAQILKKKSNSICYHAIPESVAMGECKTGHIKTEDNLADLLTNVLYGSQ